MNSTRRITALASSLMLLYLSSAHAQEQKKPNAVPETAQLRIRSITTHSPLPAYLIEASEKSYAASLQGESQLKKGDTEGAIASFQTALVYSATNTSALRGLANCYIQTGDSAKAIEAERRAVYFNDPTEQVMRDNDTANLMLFASLLDKAGQTGEAKMVYNHAASLLKYMDGKPSDGYLMPLFGAEPGQIPYTSNRLQALTQVGLGIDSLDTQEVKRTEKIAHLREAIRLYPESPVAYAYLTYQLNLSGDKAGAKAAEAHSYRLGLLKVSGLLDAQTAQMQAEKAQK